MAPAAEVMKQALATAQIRTPKVPLVSNVLARPVTDPDTIREALHAQVCGTVRWRESVAFMAEAGVSTFLELGSGKVLAGLNKRIAPDAVTQSIGTPDDVARFRSA